MARSNYTPEQLLASIPTDPKLTYDCTAWFADCARWADIERYEPVKETAWLGLKQIERLEKRNYALDTLKAQLNSYIKITPTETPPEPVTPVEPDCPEQRLTEDDYYNYPTKGPVAGTPNINDMPDLPPDPQS